MGDAETLAQRPEVIDDQAKCHREFTNIIDGLMQTLLSELSVSQQDFLAACKKAKQSGNKR